MDQIRIPTAILRELPVGTVTASCLPDLRAQTTEAWPPSLISWATCHELASNEAFELLPRVVEPLDVALVPAHDPAHERRVRKRATLWGLTNLVASLAFPLFLGVAVVGMDGRYEFGGERSLSLDCLGVTLAAWATLQWLPLVVFIAVVALRAIAADGWHPALPSLGPTLLILGALTTTGLAALGYALLARARGLSPWLALLGFVSLFFRSRNAL